MEFWSASKEASGPQDRGSSQGRTRNSLTHAVIGPNEAYESETSNHGSCNPCNHRIRGWQDFVASPLWEYVMIPFMLADSISIGMELNNRSGAAFWINMRRVSDGFLIFWILELVLRVVSVGCRNVYRH